jgi:hypothetical protein
METALDEGWTRDPFDRVIVAQARTNGYAPLVSSNEEIREKLQPGGLVTKKGRPLRSALMLRD